MSLEQQHKESLQTTQEQKTLILKLEADLSQVQPFLAVGVEGTKETSISAEIISNALRDVETDRAKVSMSGDAVGGASSLLPIVSSQRERFKQRNMELEAVSLSNHSNLNCFNYHSNIIFMAFLYTTYSQVLSLSRLSLSLSLSLRNVISKSRQFLFYKERWTLFVVTMLSYMRRLSFFKVTPEQ